MRPADGPRPRPRLGIAARTPRAGACAPLSRKFFTPPPSGEFTWALRPPATIDSRGERIALLTTWRNEPGLGPHDEQGENTDRPGAEARSTLVFSRLGMF